MSVSNVKPCREPVRCRRPSQSTWTPPPDCRATGGKHHPTYAGHSPIFIVYYSIGTSFLLLKTYVFGAKLEPYKRISCPYIGHMHSYMYITKVT